MWKNKPINITQNQADDKVEAANFRVRSTSSSKKYRYNKETSKFDIFKHFATEPENMSTNSPTPKESVQ